MMDYSVTLVSSFRVTPESGVIVDVYQTLALKDGVRSVDAYVHKSSP